MFFFFFPMHAHMRYINVYVDIICASPNLDEWWMNGCSDPVVDGFHFWWPSLHSFQSLDHAVYQGREEDMEWEAVLKAQVVTSHECIVLFPSSFGSRQIV